jgi:hypothetical protein
VKFLTKLVPQVDAAVVQRVLKREKIDEEKEDNVSFLKCLCDREPELREKNVQGTRV